MNIIIEYLTAEDKKSTRYASASYFMKGKEVNPVTTKEKFENDLAVLNTDHTPIILTIISHAHKTGLCRGGLKSSLIQWKDLYSLANCCRTKYSLKLNLLCPCNSYHIMDCIDKHNQIDEIWYSNTEIPTIKYAIISAYDCGGDFEKFKKWVKDEIGDESLFGQYKKE